METRLAGTQDIEGIVALVNENVRRGHLLPRSPETIRRTLADWLVVADGAAIMGCVSLLRYTSGLVEVRSLAVAEAAQGQGVGQALIAALVQEAQTRQIPTLFALTRAVGFFLKCGFALTEKSAFPEKVWHDCHHCPLRERCDETAVVLHLSAVYPSAETRLTANLREVPNHTLHFPAFG